MGAVGNGEPFGPFDKHRSERSATSFLGRVVDRPLWGALFNVCLWPKVAGSGMVAVRLSPGVRGLRSGC